MREITRKIVRIVNAVVYGGSALSASVAVFIQKSALGRFFVRSLVAALDAAPRLQAF